MDLRGRGMGTMKDPKMLEKKTKLIELVQSYCREHLNEEYEQLSAKMVEKLGRKRTVPFMSGKLERNPFNNLLSINGLIVPRDILE
jgi:hypothetical protein